MLFCGVSHLADETQDTHPALLNSLGSLSFLHLTLHRRDSGEQPSISSFVDDRLPEETWHSQFWSLRIDSSTVRLRYLIAPSFVPTPLEIVEILRIDLQHDDDNVSSSFLTWETTSRS